MTYTPVTLTPPFCAHVLNIEVSRAVGVSTHQDPSFWDKEGEQFDAFAQCPRLATPKWTKHEGGDLGEEVGGANTRS